MAVLSPHTVPLLSPPFPGPQGVLVSGPRLQGREPLGPGSPLLTPDLSGLGRGLLSPSSTFLNPRSHFPYNVMLQFLAARPPSTFSSGSASPHLLGGFQSDDGGLGMVKGLSDPAPRAAPPSHQGGGGRGLERGPFSSPLCSCRVSLAPSWHLEKFGKLKKTHVFLKSLSLAPQPCQGATAKRKKERGGLGE